MSSAICQATTTAGKKCSRGVSTKKDTDPHFCWQHQKSAPVTTVPVQASSTTKTHVPTHTFNITSGQMFVGDIGYAYDADFKTKKVTKTWDSLNNLGVFLKSVRVGEWTFEEHGDLNNPEDTSIWVLLRAKGANFKACEWTSVGDASTDAAMIGFFDNQKVQELSGSELQTMAEDEASSMNKYPLGLTISSFLLFL